MIDKNEYLMKPLASLFSFIVDLGCCGVLWMCYGGIVIGFYHYFGATPNYSGVIPEFHPRRNTTTPV